MQGLWTSRLQLLRRTPIFQQSAKYHKQSTPRRFRGMPEGFFAWRPPSNPVQTSFHYRVFGRAFATRRSYVPYATYTSAYYTIWGFIALNTAVFGAWQYATARQDRNLLTKLRENFTSSIQNCKEGRWYTLLTSAVSQQIPVHFLFNMIAFHAFGGLLSLVGVGGFHIMTLCIGSALVGSGAQIYQWANDTSDPTRSFKSGLGASGVVMGAAAAATCLVPRAPMQMMFIPVNIPLWVLTIAYVGIDTFYLHSNSQIGHAAHLGGSVFGLAYYGAYLRRFGGIWNMFGRRGWR